MNCEAHPFVYLLIGVFEHYTTLHKYDASLDRFGTANEWLCNYDLLSGSARMSNEFGAVQYQAYSIVPIYKHMAAAGNAKAERPTVYWDVSCIPSHLQNRVFIFVL